MVTSLDAMKNAVSDPKRETVSAEVSKKIFSAYRQASELLSKLNEEEAQQKLLSALQQYKSTLDKEADRQAIDAIYAADINIYEKCEKALDFFATHWHKTLVVREPSITEQEVRDALKRVTDRRNIDTAYKVMEEDKHLEALFGEIIEKKLTILAEQQALAVKQLEEANQRLATFQVKYAQHGVGNKMTAKK